MFRLRRKKGQGAIEYLFMIAAALVIILIAVRYVGQSGQQAQEQGNIAQLQSQAELAKSSLIGRGLWDDDYKVVLSDDKYLLLQDTTTLLNVTATHKDKYSSYKHEGTSITAGIELKNVYEDCMASTEAACYVLMDLGGSS